MATRAYSVPWINGRQRINYSNTSENSAKVNGKLQLAVHAHSFVHNVVTGSSSNFGGTDCQGAETSESLPFTTAMDNEVYSKFVGKLHSGSADLGVTFASWGQTAQMLQDRLEKLNDFFSLRRVSRRRRRRRPQREDRFSRRALASDVLEGEFGWVPLVKDIHAALVTACGKNAVPSTWVRASSGFTRYDVYDDGGTFPRTRQTKSGSGRVTYAAAVAVTNPNLWLLNRLGLINPLTVAWDRVPWSFVVNMFVNVNQIIGSLSDTVGLTLSGVNVTRSCRILREQQIWWKDFYGQGQHRISSCNVLSKRRDRFITGGSLPRPSLQLKAPNIDWNLAVIASALVVQKVKALH